MNAPVALASLDYAKPLQVDAELAALTDMIRAEGVRSYLEIGARYGGSFETIMMAMGPETRGLAVDFPGGAFGDEGSAPILLSAIDRLRKAGRNAGYVFGPSTSPEVIERAAYRAPYDAVLIDADHSYAAVKRDFWTFAPMARMVILHDIVHPADIRSRAGHVVEVPRFWAEIKPHYRHREIVAPGSAMGIGVIWRGA